MKKIQIFSDEMVKLMPELKEAIDEGWKRGYDVNHWIILEENDYKLLLEDVRK